MAQLSLSQLLYFVGKFNEIIINSTFLIYLFNFIETICELKFWFDIISYENNLLSTPWRLYRHWLLRKCLLKDVLLSELTNTMRGAAVSTERPFEEKYTRLLLWTVCFHFISIHLCFSFLIFTISLSDNPRLKTLLWKYLECKKLELELGNWIEGITG